jgi:lysophospholipid acyltransferase (LPLAT)-like uncharacterized protein
LAIQTDAKTDPNNDANGAPGFRLSASQRLKARAIAVAGYPIVYALGRTWTWSVEGASRFDDIVRSGRQPILALWHGRILPATLFWRDRGIVALTSANFDGEWTAQLMGRFGYRAARGSTSRGGSRALVQLRRELAAGHAVAFTVDGPRGPAQVVQPGAVWLAGATGQPLLPFHIEASSHWTARSWDAAQIPRPAARVAVSIGAPLAVSSTDDAVLKTCTADLKEALKALEARALQMIRPDGTHA